MAVTPSHAAFIEAYPEFGTAPQAFVETKLAEAAERTSSAYQSASITQRAVFLRAAILLLASPYSRQMRADDASNDALRYEWELKQLQRSGMLGFRVF